MRFPLHRSAAALIAALALAGCGRSDSHLRAMVSSQIAADAMTKTAHIDVAVTDHVVHLTGTVENHAQPARAVLIAEAVKGVTRVTTDLKLSDSGLAALVRQALAADAAVAGVPITVAASRGYVTLSSTATGPDDRRRAVEIARKVDGVMTVVDDMK